MSFRCTTCEGDRELQAGCETCFGSGFLRDVAWCPRPWDEVFPNLFTGGHDWAGDPPTWKGTTTLTYHLEEEGFETVISFYSRPGSQPPPGVEHHEFFAVDGVLDDVELKNFHRLAGIAVDRVWRGHKVLIRCQAGLNRSSLCTALALRQLGFTSREAIDHIRATRSPDCLCNGDFVDYLLALDGEG